LKFLDCGIVSSPRSQATDNFSLLSCVNYSQPATLLHPLRLRNGSAAEPEFGVTPKSSPCPRLD
jgi:hypothetical protein